MKQNVGNAFKKIWLGDLLQLKNLKKVQKNDLCVSTPVLNELL